MDRLSWDNTVEYALISESQGRVVIPEPINFDDGNGNIYTRDDKSKGFLTTKSNDLEFHGAGNDFLQTQSWNKGIAEDVLLDKRIKSDDRIDEAWRPASRNYLDMGEHTVDEKSGGTKISKTKVAEGGLKKLIDSKLSDEFDLTSTLDIDGNTIDSLITSTLFNDGKQVLLRSELSVEDGTQVRAVVSGGDQLNGQCFPFVVDINSDSENIDNSISDKISASSDFYSDLISLYQTAPFLTASDTTKSLKINGKVKATVSDPHDGVSPLDLARLDIVIYESGGDFLFKEAILLDQCDPAVGGSFVEYTFSDYELLVNQGESVAIGLLSKTTDGILWTMTETAIVIEEESIFAPTDSRCLTYKQAFNRLLYLITGTKDLVSSDLLTTGELAEDVINNGFWARGFPDVHNEGTDEERKISFNISLGNLIEHIDALIPIAWGVKVIGNVEYFWIEPLIYTQQNFAGVNFLNTTTNRLTGKISTAYIKAESIKRKKLKKNFYGKLEFGSSKGGDKYEEVYGLQSVSGKAEFTTVNSKSDSKYSKLSPFRLGDVDQELARRKPYDLYPDTDTRYDSDIMCVRAMLEGGKYYLKRWTDVPYETAPTGVYSVDTAYNLEFTPAQLMLKHGFVINVGLFHYSKGVNDANIVFASSNCNSAFKSKKVGEDILEEDGLIPNSRLDAPRTRPWIMECNAKVSQEIEDSITGETNGVPNWYGLVSILTNDGLQQFRLVKSDVNKEGKHKFVEAFINTTL